MTSSKKIITGIVIFYIILALLTVGADVLNSSLRREYNARVKMSEKIAKTAFSKTIVCSSPTGGYSGVGWSLKAKFPTAYNMPLEEGIEFDLSGKFSNRLILPVLYIEIIAEDFEIIYNGEVKADECEFLCENIDVEYAYVPDIPSYDTLATFSDKVKLRYVGEDEGVRTGYILIGANTVYDGNEVIDPGYAKIYYATDGEYIAFSSSSTYGAEKSLEFDTDIFGGGE